MTRSRLLALLVVPALALPALSGCGAEEAAGVDVAQAAAATTRKGTAHIEMRMHMTGLGLPQPVDLTASGVTALREAKMNIAFDFGALLSSLGASGVGKMEMRLDGARLYVKPPEIQALNLPEWIGLDLRRVARAMGIDPEAAGVLFTVDPASQLRALKAAGGLKQAGTEEIDGTRTTHYKGTISAKDTLAALPAAKRAKVQKALAQLAKLSDQDPTRQRVPTELWIGDDAIVRRMRIATELPSQNGAQPGGMEMTYELSDFGAALDVSRPDGVVDYTSKLTGALAAGLKGRGGTSAG